MARLTCPHCGQPLPEARLGVALPPMLIRLLDAVRHSPATSIELASRFEISPSCVRTHIARLREYLADTPFRIASARHYGYSVERRKLPPIDRSPQPWWRSNP